MNPPPLAAVQRALYGALSGDPFLASAAAVYDEVPEGAELPYVVLGEVFVTPANRLAAPGWELLATLHIWSASPGFAEPLALAERVTALLDHQPLEVDGYRHVVTRFESLQTLRDPDPRLRHVPVTFRVIVET